MKQKLKSYWYNFLFVASYLAFAFGIPYLIQFQFNFFGATYVTLFEILKLWFGFFFSGLMIWLIFLSTIKDKKK